MGQKVHPYGFGLGYTKPWKWLRFADVKPSDARLGVRSGHPEQAKRAEGSDEES